MFLLKEVEQLYRKFSNSVYQPGVLDAKTKELIALACSVMADCVPCIKFHYGGVAKAGASTEEIAEALAISMSISSGSKWAKYRSLIEELEK